MNSPGAIPQPSAARTVGIGAALVSEPELGLQALFETHYRPMVRLAFAIVSNRDESEEVVQDAFVDLFRRWDGLLNPAGYLRTAVVNGARRVLRRRIQRDAIYRRLRHQARPLDTHRDYLIDVLERLPERQRVAVVLAYYGGLNGPEIGEALGCADGAARSLVHRGLKRIRTELGHV